MNSIIEIIQTYGLLAVFLVMLLQSIGLPLPAYAVLLVAAALTEPSWYNLIGLAVTGMVGTLIGDFILYYIGKRHGTRVLGKLCKISLSPDSCVSNTGNLFERFGPRALTFIKFIPGLSTLAPVIAGAYAMPVALFGLFISVGAFIYVGIAVAIGVIFRSAINDIVVTIQNYGRLGGGIVIGLLGVYLFFKWLQRYRLIKQFRMDRVTVDDLAYLISNDNKPIIFDARLSDQREIDGIIPGSVPIDENDLDQVVGLYAQEKEVVIYCSCPNEITAARIAKKLRKAGFKRIRPLLGGIDAWRGSGKAVVFL